jgi:hypothetical protein
MKLGLARNLHALIDELYFTDYQELSFSRKVKYLQQAYLLVTFLNCYWFEGLLLYPTNKVQIRKLLSACLITVFLPQK